MALSKLVRRPAGVAVPLQELTESSAGDEPQDGTDDPAAGELCAGFDTGKEVMNSDGGHDTIKERIMPAIECSRVERCATPTIQ